MLNPSLTPSARESRIATGLHLIWRTWGSLSSSDIFRFHMCLLAESFDVKPPMNGFFRLLRPHRPIRRRRPLPQWTGALGQLAKALRPAQKSSFDHSSSKSSRPKRVAYDRSPTGWPSSRVWALQLLTRHLYLLESHMYLLLRIWMGNHRCLG